MQPTSKHCETCGTEFHPRPGRSAKQWARMRFCCTAHANQWRARQQTKLPTTKRRQGEGWARWWEHRRRTEDRADLRRKPKVWPHCKLSHAPKPRRFIGRWCRACGAGWLNYGDRVDAIYCTPCNRARWRETHYQRAARYGLRYEPVDPKRIFERDGWRCQICGTKTSGNWPNPKCPTLDHIIPMARGGDHSLDNLQCAHLSCNASKGARSANDQLRLALDGG